MNRMAHNGIGGFSVNLVTRRKMSKSLSDYLSAVDRLPELHERLQHVLVYNRDGLELMDKFCGDECFLYCDPPYVWSTRGSTRYAVDNDSEWHGRFVEKCILSKAKILVSGYDCDEYKPLEDNGFTKITFDVTVMDGAFRPNDRVECLWKNY
jgi:DNA adenine methylase